MAQNHLDFETLYSLAKANLTGSDRLHAEAHLSACPECQEVLKELKEMMESFESYEPGDIKKPVPRKVLEAIPEPIKERGAFVKLSFGKDRLLEKVQGVVKSMGGILDSIADLTIEALAPDTEFLAETRGESLPITDYRTHYKDLDIVFSVLPEQNTVEVYVTIENKTPTDLTDINFHLADEEGKKYHPESRVEAKDSLILVFTQPELSEKTYEFRISSEPVTD
jgi:hypothetical protein